MFAFLFCLLILTVTANPCRAQAPQFDGNRGLVPVSTYLPFTDIAPPQFRRIELSGVNVSDDYLKEILENTKRRVFRFVQMPVRIYIQPTSHQFEEACVRAYENWQTRSNGLVTFVRLNQPEHARVRIVWTHLGAAPGTGDSLGGNTITKWHVAPNGSLLSVKGVPLPVFIPKGVYKLSVPPQVVQINLDPVEKLDAELQPLLVENLVTHELGHALGLLGHSLDGGDLMYHNTDIFSRLSQRDINTLRKLYTLKPDAEL